MQPQYRNADSGFEPRRIDMKHTPGCPCTRCINALAAAIVTEAIEEGSARRAWATTLDNGTKMLIETHPTKELEITGHFVLVLH
jgi:hypothetical protein